MPSRKTDVNLTNRGGIHYQDSNLNLVRGSLLASLQAANLLPVGTLSQAAPPADTSVFWIDEGSDPETLNYHNGTGWIAASFQDVYFPDGYYRGSFSSTSVATSSITNKSTGDVVIVGSGLSARPVRWDGTQWLDKIIESNITVTIGSGGDFATWELFREAYSQHKTTNLSILTVSFLAGSHNIVDPFIGFDLKGLRLRIQGAGSALTTITGSSQYVFIFSDGSETLISDLTIQGKGIIVNNGSRVFVESDVVVDSADVNGIVVNGTSILDSRNSGGLTVTNSSSIQILVEDCSSATLFNVLVQNGGAGGVQVSDNSTLDFSNSTISNHASSVGLFALRNANIVMDNGTVTGCNEGVVSSESSIVKVTGSNISGNTVLDTSPAIGLEGNRNSLVYA